MADDQDIHLEINVETSTDDNEGIATGIASVNESTTPDRTIVFSIESTAKLREDKVRDPRPSVWLSVFKCLFGAILSAMLLTSVIASKLSLISIGTFYNSTRSGCPNNSDVKHSKETTFIMMVLILMIPQFMSFLRACWRSLCSEIHPWPSTIAIRWTVFAAVLEVFGLSFFVVVVVLKTTLSAAHCVVIMNCLFLFPIICKLSPKRLKTLFQESKDQFVLLIVSLLLELSGTVLLSIDVIENKKNVNLQEAIGIIISLLLVSLAWSKPLQIRQIKPRNNNDKHVSSNNHSGSVESAQTAASENDMKDESKDFLKENARYKSTIISSIVKLIITPFVAALFCYLFDVADLKDLNGGFLSFSHNHPAFVHFMTQIFTSITGSVLGWLACAMCMQRIAFFLPMLLATPLSLGLISIPKMCCTSAIPLKCLDIKDTYLLPMAVCLWLAQVLSTGMYLWKEQTFIMAKESSLFWLPVYNDAFLEQNLLLNRKNKTTDDSKINRADVAKRSRVYICTTMFHENRTEMERLLGSLRDIDTARSKSERNFESHIFFDGAVKGDVLGEFALQLISLVPKTLGVKIDKCMKIRTPYGMQLRWTLPGGMPFCIHLKDNLKVKNKKRWSQAMYMSYVLDYKKAIMETDHSMESDDDNTYILATDADVRFTHESVQALLDLMMRDQKVGAVCGRTHPLGSGPVVWYQVFDYAIGHWFQKVANHVLGSVLCSPGCFSVYRARAIRDVLPIYVSPVETSIDFLTKDMGEDRWMCTLMVQSGWRLEYCAAAEDSTFCPDTFDEFFNQRRRWIPSTLVNLIQLISEWKVTVKNNDKISIFFIFYQALLVASTLISPATVILVITGALKYSKLPGSENDVAVLILLCIITFGFGIICLYTTKSFQLKVAKILTVAFSLLMAATTIGMASQIAIDLNKRSQCDESSTIAVNTSTSVRTTPATALPNECTDGFPADLSSLYLAGLVGIYFAAALVHPSEAYCLVHGIWYLLCLPSGYLLLIIYSLANITDKSWGTREGKTVGDDKPWYNVQWQQLKSLCFCCRPESVKTQTEDSNEKKSVKTQTEDSSEKKSVKTQTEDSTEQHQPGEDGTTDAVNSDGNSPSANDNERENPSATEGRPVIPPKESPEAELQMPIENWPWLAELKEPYLVYKKNFIDNGYENISFLIGMTDEDLKSIGIDKQGHRSKILDEIKKIPYAPDTDVPKNLEEWLRKLGLTEYWIQFEHNGYIKPQILERLKTMETETLREELREELKILKRGHLNKMVKAIKDMQYATSAQRKIRKAREVVDKVPLSDINGKELFFWTELRSKCLLPESEVFGGVTELKGKLKDLRNSFLTVFAIANVMWIITIITLDKQAELKFRGTNAIGLVFLFVYGLVIVIQFFTMIWHRLSTLCHLLARAPWKRGPYQLSWAFKDEDLVPEPKEQTTEEEPDPSKLSSASSASFKRRRRSSIQNAVAYKMQQRRCTTDELESFLYSEN